MSMRIALFHNLPSGGAKRHTFEQVRELARRGHEIVEFVPSTADLSFFSLAPLVREQRLYPCQPPTQIHRRIPFLTPYVNTWLSIDGLRRTERVNSTIARDIDAGGFDVVLAKDCCIILKPYVLRYLKTRSAYQCHHTWGHKIHAPQIGSRSMVRRAKSAYYWLARAYYQHRFDTDETRNLRSASRVLTNSRYTQGVLSERYQVTSHVLYPGIDTNVFRPLETDTGGYVLSVGALTYWKGHRFVVSALGRIPAEQRPPLWIVAASIDPDEEQVVSEMAARLGVDLHVESIADDRRLAEVYGRASVFAFASIGEPLGMAPLEAAACGTPIVAVAEGGVCETMRDGVTGWLVERDEQAFADRLVSLLSDEPKRRQMGDCAMAYVRENWTWRAAVDRLEVQLQAAQT